MKTSSYKYHSLHIPMHGPMVDASFFKLSKKHKNQKLEMRASVHSIAMLETITITVVSLLVVMCIFFFVITLSLDSTTPIVILSLSRVVFV